MKVKPQNLLIIMSDEHSTKALGCYGSEIVKTPNLDALAARGTRFESAYCSSPVCIPARASFAVGKYIHQIGYWDNADAYDGAIPSWHHKLRDRQHEVVSIGKLHFPRPSRGRPRLLGGEARHACGGWQGRPARADPRRDGAAAQGRREDVRQRRPR